MFLSTKKEFYKLSSGVIFGSPTLHPTTQGFSSSLPITYLILLFPLLPLLFRLLHLFFFFNNTTLTKPTQLLPVNLLQHHFHLAQSIFTRLGVLPTLQNGIPVPSWSHLRLLFHSYFSLFLKTETLLKPAWCTHYSPINHKTFMS